MLNHLCIEDHFDRSCIDCILSLAPRDHSLNLSNMAFRLIGSDREIALPSSAMCDEIFVLLIKAINNLLKVAFYG